jgi:hypothetical protein
MVKDLQTPTNLSLRVDQTNVFTKNIERAKATE